MSMTLSQFQGKSVQEIFIFTANTVWTPPVSGRALFIAVGPGGGGAGNGANVSLSTQGFPGSPGGGGGGCCVKEITLNTAATYTINVGTGGIGGSNTQGGSAAVVAGNGSGNTSVVSNDGVINLQAGFGTAGTYSGNTKAANAVGGSGGSAANGDYNFTGGSSANANANISFQWVLPVTVTSPLSSYSASGILYVTGGAGAGFYSNGANATANSYSGASSVYSPIANDSTLLYLTPNRIEGGAANTPVNVNYLGTPGAKGYGECGDGGYSVQFDMSQVNNLAAPTNNNYMVQAGSGGDYAGGGGAYVLNQAGQTTGMAVIGGNGQLGGGGGGALLNFNSSGKAGSWAVIGGRGGDGIVIVKVVRG
jgi:hypothetical protein